ncbi:class I SAM-dependent methyltransferase [Marichromatium sp. AB31]|uniref:class I SAM-dependent methyltransferase n=1 Tax=Marichromatium sp. AB31 TaxID=2483362 RepID=UPI000F3C5949|nr:class I SAM-dependent methyltransferase [Marichromatium sp. AB31]RNE88525.1 methyltransferase domain-containing protein [Marichromatium sp. AB31]
MNCRHCGAPLRLPFVDLGSAPPSNAYLSAAALHRPESWYPLRVLVCERCWLVQTEDFARPETLFDADYAYFSSVSTSWVAHAERYVATMVERLGLDGDSRVVELAANDGYLLQHLQARAIPCLGVEPTAAVAAAARERGLEIVEAFFDRALAARLLAEGWGADLVVANNVLAHVPAINDFVAGIALLLRPDGVATFEFPHLLRLIAGNQFDTLYHEHYSYLSLGAVGRVCAANGLAVFDVETLPTHGGSLRVFAQRADHGARPTTPRVAALRAEELAAGLERAATYQGLQARAERLRLELLDYLIRARRQGLQVVGYGAAAKGNTLLNFAGVRPDLLHYVVDRSPGKLGRHLPGSRIPIVAESRLRETRPDRVLLLPWNLRDELTAQLGYVREWGARFVVAVPRLCEC